VSADGPVDDARAAAYEQYVRSEWAMYLADPARAAATHAAAAGVSVARVLEVGCGAGQEMLPFARDGAYCVGLDPFPTAGRHGLRLYAETVPAARVGYLGGAAEALPFPDAAFDVIICRLALPYTDNALALAEMRRVLAPGGVAIIKIHHGWYYLRHCWRGIVHLRPRMLLNAARTAAATVACRLAGRRVAHGVLGLETFQTRGGFRRTAGRAGLAIRGEMPDSNHFTPSYILGHD